MPLNMQFFLYL